MTEEELFEQWWSKHQDETWDTALTAQERAERKKRSPIWGCAFKKDARLAWMARADMAAKSELSGHQRPAQE